MSGTGQEQTEREWPVWLHQMPSEEVMALAAGGSTLAAEYIAYCETVAAAAATEQL